MRQSDLIKTYRYRFLLTFNSN